MPDFWTTFAALVSGLILTCIAERYNGILNFNDLQLLYSYPVMQMVAIIHLHMLSSFTSIFHMSHQAMSILRADGGPLKKLENGLLFARS